MENYLDVQNSIFNGFKKYGDIEKFLDDLHEVFIKHNIKLVRSDFMEMVKDSLVIRGSEFVANTRVEMSSENRIDEGTNIYFQSNVDKYKKAFEVVNKENQKYKKLVDALKEALEME